MFPLKEGNLQLNSSLLNTYSAPVTVLGTGHSKVNKTGFLLSRAEESGELETT